MLFFCSCPTPARTRPGRSVPAPVRELPEPGPLEPETPADPEGDRRAAEAAGALYWPGARILALPFH